MLKPRSLLVSLVLICPFVSVLFSATISGTVYDESINPVAGALVKLEKDASLAGQVITDSSGTYSFTDLAGGAYLLTASVKRDNVTLQTEVRLNFTENDAARIDLLLVEEFGISPPDLISVEEGAEFPTLVEEVSGLRETNWILIAVFVVVMAAALLIIRYLLGRERETLKAEFKRLEEERKAAPPPAPQPPLGRYLTDEEKIYQLIQRRGEVPQKDIVIETGFSTAKVSLILAKLEKMGKIRRTVVGREKIIKLAE